MPQEYEQSFQIKNEHYLASIHLANHLTECYFTLIPRDETLLITAAELEALLESNEIRIGLDRDILLQLSEKIAAHEPIADVLVAHGALPEIGQPAFLEFKTKPFSYEPNFNEAETNGQIDFHQTHLFENVKSGDVIGIAHPAIPSKNGQTVTGKIIPTSPLRTTAATLGSGVKFDDVQNEYIALINGRVMYKDSVLSVTEEFLVEEDVDYKVGHIDFVGFVTVRGDVLDGFNVRGKKGVKIYNNVGNSNIISEGDIDLGGMTGRDGGAQIRCQGRVKAGYLYNVDVECNGDVVVQREIMHCNIKSNGIIRCQGRIVGGTCLALGGIETVIAGSEFGIKTFLNAGIDFHVANTVHQFVAQLQAIQKHLGELSAQLEKAQTETPANTQHLTLLHAELEKARLLKDKALEKLKWLQANMSMHANPKINIGKEAFPGVSFQLGQSELEFKQSHPGPFSAIEIIGSEMRFLPLTPLTRKASDLELEILARENSE